MPKESLISIVVPIFNWANFIDRCVNSLISQTYKNLEIILIDDWSNDNSLDIIKNWSKKDERIKFYTQKNHWLSYTRNKWIDCSSWEYITFVDIDDFIKNDFIEVLTKNWNGSDIIIWWFIKYKSNGSTKNCFVKNNRMWIYLNTNQWARIFKSDFLKHTNLKFANWYLREDALFNINAYNLTKSIKVVKYAWYYYFIENNNSITRKIFKQYDPDFVNRLNLFLKISPCNEKDKCIIEYCLIRACIVSLLYTWQYNTKEEFMKEYKRLFSRLRENIGKYRRNKYIYIWEEINLYYKLWIMWFIIMDRLKLINIFSKIWCRS